MWCITNQALPFVTSGSEFLLTGTTIMCFFSATKSNYCSSLPIIRLDPLLLAVMHHKSSAPFITSGLGASHKHLVFLHCNSVNETKSNQPPPSTSRLSPLNRQVMHHKSSAPFITSLPELPSTVHVQAPCVFSATKSANLLLSPSPPQSFT